MRIYDISRPISPALANWTGDTPYRLDRMLQLANGDTVNLGTITTSLHTGTHADAPYHFDDSGRTIDRVPLKIYIGAAQVIDVSGVDVIHPVHLQPRFDSEIPRLLLKTNAWTDDSRFPSEIPVLAAETIDFLGEHEIKLLGVDVPSVDRIESKALPNHHALHRNGIHILESLRLTDVAAGIYELIALPLPFAGADASPVRAILRR